jgi:hypothetical protein
VTKDQKKSDEKSVIKTDDLSNRVLYGSPTIGGALVLGVIKTLSFSLHFLSNKKRQL